MLLLLLPFLFNPFGFISRWLPAFYLALWPMIIQTLGRETLLTHSLTLMLFIFTCDITRQTMIKTIGFDLMSLPLGLAVVAALTTEKGTAFLYFVRPLFDGLLTIVEPAFLIIETYLILDIIRSFNRWISRKANERDEDSYDVSSWEQPLSRAAILARTFVILITLLSYLGAYLLIQESKSLLGTSDDSPINFNQAIAMLVSLQLIALAMTIYKEEGVISESANICLCASAPILIAAWSFHHLRGSTEVQKSSCYFPFSLLPFGCPTWAGGGSSGAYTSPADTHHSSGARADADDPFGFNSANENLWTSPSGSRASRTVLTSSEDDNFGQLILGQVGLLSGPFGSSTRQLLLLLTRKLIMIINSVSGVNVNQLARYYFEPNFWLILVGRLVCVTWWTFRASKPAGEHNGGPGELIQRRFGANEAGERVRRSGWLSRLPVGRTTLVKLLLVLAYTQMLVQRIHNRDQLLLADTQTPTSAGELACCSARADSSPATRTPAPASSDGWMATDWFVCLWTSAQTCASAADQSGARPTLSGALGELLVAVWASLEWLQTKAVELLAWLPASLWSHWLLRLRSSIVQRLLQSVLLQLAYLAASATSSSDEEDD